MWYLYRITNIVNNKVYIGQSVDPKTRWSRHRSDAKYSEKNRNYHLTDAIKKYGVDSFLFEIIAQAKTLEDMDELETLCIEQYKSTNPQFGYNNSPGGQGKRPMSLETKRRLSESLKGRISPMKGKHQSDAAKALLSKANKGKIGNMKGKHHSVETKNLLSKINTGKVYSDDTKNKKSKSMIGKNSGSQNGMYGKKSIRAKLTQEQANDIRCEYSNGGISLLKLSVKYGVSKKTILNIVHWKIYK